MGDLGSPLSPPLAAVVPRWQRTRATPDPGGTSAAASPPPGGLFAARLLDVDCAPKVLPPIEGILSLPPLSVRDAVAALNGLVSSIVTRAWTAQQFAEDLLRMYGPNRHGLSLDEIAAINLYTQEGVHTAINTALRQQDRRAVRPFVDLLRLLLGGLRKLPTRESTLFRGVVGDLSAEYPVGRKFFWWGFSSATADGDVLKDPAFLGTFGFRSLFSIEQRSGRDISDYSNYTESEVLLEPGLQFEVRNRMDIPGSSGVTLYVVRELQTPFAMVS
eukprot:NODE_2054_length_1005_cov_228.875789.p1 GENE.NODE_2054_length_1005_cov_228.875789~~NODE_2054_length_1005_cov_228.875789.p1  ORF type:complete len:274 (+),score=74.18 NODE_2054_length_1005_cov_228.875789:3-824(+)